MGSARDETEVLPHLDAAYRFARWLSHSLDDSEDVVQKGELCALRGFDSLRDPDMKAWPPAIVKYWHSTALKQQTATSS
jgi:DNA-directed RNA polymerase specialized sigma24 family protein